jgi:formylglycine-generating enzyme required for sulfatase activity
MNAQAAATYYRGSSQRNLAWPDVGFRCAKSVSGD